MITTSAHYSATQTLNKQGGAKQRTLSGVIHRHSVLAGQASSQRWLRSASTVQSAAPHVLETASKGTESLEMQFDRWNLLQAFSHPFHKWYNCKKKILCFDNIKMDTMSSVRSSIFFLFLKRQFPALHISKYPMEYRIG
jgi:hypothetical protein